MLIAVPTPEVDSLHFHHLQMEVVVGRDLPKGKKKKTNTAASNILSELIYKASR